MSLALKVLKMYAPPAFKRTVLQELYRATARAFDAAPPAGLRRLSLADLLESYAAFTKGEAGRLLDDAGRAALVAERLYRETRALGKRLRRTLRLRTPAEIMAASQILYAALGIDFEGRERGEVTIRRCYFSGFYTAGICRVMSSADAGVAAGLSGGGRLAFSQRITEGADVCLAHLDTEEPAR
jgi:hypothetical protein